MQSQRHLKVSRGVVFLVSQLSTTLLNIGLSPISLDSFKPTFSFLVNISGDIIQPLYLNSVVVPVFLSTSFFVSKSSQVFYFLFSHLINSLVSCLVKIPSAWNCSISPLTMIDFDIKESPLSSLQYSSMTYSLLFQSVHYGIHLLK